MDICQPDPFPLLNVVEIAGANYRWQLNGVDIPGASTNQLQVNEPGTYTIFIEQNSCYLTNSITINEYRNQKLN